MVGPSYYYLVGYMLLLSFFIIILVVAMMMVQLLQHKGLSPVESDNKPVEFG